MSGYVLPCNLPNFQQSAPRGDEWRVDPSASHQMTWKNQDTGETIVCPSIWYNLPAESYAKDLRYNAERNDECAAYKDTEGKPWSNGEAERSRHQARRLRAMALLCDRNPHVAAGSIDFRGLSDPITPRETEVEIIQDIEAGN